MEKRENQRVMLTKKLLLDALLKLLEKKHINDVSVTELCRCAGVNRATFYKHYATPNDILAQHVDMHVSRIIQILNRPCRKKVELLEDGCWYVYEHADLFRIFANNHMDDEFACRIFVQMLQQSPLPRSLIQTSYDGDDVKLMVSYVASGYYYLIRRWLLEDIQKTPQEIAALMLKLSPQGLIE